MECTEFIKAFSDPTRLRLVQLLISAESISVNDLAEHLGITQYNVSKHLRILKNADIVSAKATGTRREYFITSHFRTRLEKEGPVMNLGEANLRFDEQMLK